MGKVVPLTTHNAEIKTTTVELKTLTVVWVTVPWVRTHPLRQK
jgi:hypothetical protein